MNGLEKRLQAIHGRVESPFPACWCSHKIASDNDLANLMAFYAKGRSDSTFEHGIQVALQPTSLLT